MKISKAIEILELNVPKAKSEMPPGIKAALKLGIEALKRLAYDREHYFVLNLRPLPGETPED